MKIVCIGDFHVPDRYEKIPSWEKKKIKEEAPDKIISTGDFTSEKTLKEIQRLGDTIAVQGNMDWIKLPAHGVLEIREGLNVGVVHGNGIVPRGDIHQLSSYAKKMKARVLIHGHTHQLSIQKENGVLYINPGSATGSEGGGSSGEKESFVILEIEDDKAKVRKIFKDKEEEEEYEL